MANWKKVIVSGSNAHLNHITASGNISASGKLFGNLPENTDIQEVVVYNTATGRLEHKILNLVSTRKAAGLYLADMTTDFSQTFKLSYDTGSTISGPTPYFKLSASINDGSSYTILPADNIDFVGLNETWNQREPTQQAYYSEGGLGVNITSSISGSRQGLNVGSDKPTVTMVLQAIDDTVTATPGYDTSQSNLQYFAKSFNLPQSGTIEVYVNDNDTPVITQNLTTASGVVDETNDNVTLNLSAVRFNSQSDQTGDDTKAARSGSITIASAKQRDGYNFAYLIHKPGGSASPSHRITNFNEWFYDTAGAGTAMSTVEHGIVSTASFDMSSTASISGIKFFTSSQEGATLRYGAKINNQYRNVYPTSNGISMDNITGDTVGSVSITQSGTYQVETFNTAQSVGSGDNTDIDFDLAPLQANASAYTTDTKVTASFNIDFDLESGDQSFYQPSTFIDSFADANSGTDISSTDNIISFNPTFTHINSHKSDLVIGEQNFGDYMLNQLPVNATERNFEDFRGETFRLVSRSYAGTAAEAAAITSSTHAWDGEKNVVDGGAGYQSGSIVYYSHLLYPTGAGIGGEFDVSLGPTGSGVQPNNYTGAIGNREYLRYFKMNSSDNGAKQVTIELLGNGKIVTDGNTNHFNTGDNDAIKIQASRTQATGNTTVYTGEFLNVLSNGFYIGSTQTNTSFIDIATSAASIDYSGNVGVIKFADSTNASFQENDILVLRIIVPLNWAGNIDALSVRTGTSQTTLLGSSGFTPL